MRKTLIITALLAVPALAQMPPPASTDPRAVTAGTYAIEPHHTQVQFAVDHMGFSTYRGSFSGASGTAMLDPAHPARNSLDVSVPVASVTTDAAKLTDELKSAEWLDAGKYPTMRFVSRSVRVTAPGRAEVSGDLTLHGVTRPVVFHAAFHGAGNNPLSKAYTAGFDVSGTVNRSDFGVKTYVPLISDAVQVTIAAALERKG